MERISPAQLIRAANITARHRLSDAFGHLCYRDAASQTIRVTPPKPLALLSTTDEPVAVALDAPDLPPGAPKEAWIHLALLRDRPDLNAICRAQPPRVAAFASLQRKFSILNGHAALVGEIAVYADSRLIRDEASAYRLSHCLGNADSVILAGNGAVTGGVDLAHAVARMWLLEKTAELNLRAWAAGSPTGISSEEQQWWRERSGELLPRIYAYLDNTYSQGAGND